jgi:dTDP-4-amino-4,6-dideoxygalactose transaminase
MFIEKKRSIVKAYNEHFKNLKGVKPLNWNLEETAPFTYIIRVLGGKRDEMMDFLQNKGVGTGIHYIANHIQPYFSQYAQPLPVTEKIWKEILTLPLYYDMTENDVDLVVQSVQEFCGL